MRDNPCKLEPRVTPIPTLLIALKHDEIKTQTQIASLELQGPWAIRRNIRLELLEIRQLMSLQINALKYDAG